MQSRTASRIKLGVVLILVVLIAVLGLSGSLRIGKYRFYPFADFLDPGLDLGGGLSATYAATEATAEDAAALLESAESADERSGVAGQRGADMQKQQHKRDHQQNACHRDRPAQIPTPSSHFMCEIAP